MKAIIYFVILTFFIFFSISAYSYDADFHKEITKEAIEESYLSDYFENNLGFNLNNKFRGPGLGLVSNIPSTKTAEEWIIYGSWKEDNPPNPGRAITHFYNPIADPPTIPARLTDRHDYNATDSLQRARDNHPYNFSWADARDYYYLALTSETEEERERNYAKMFRALGQVLHLLEDAASPAHARNDAHLSILGVGDPDSCEKFIKSFSSGMAIDPPPMFDTLDDYWDSDVNSNAYGNGIAEYTNRNFLSDDTMFLEPDDPKANIHYFTHPNKSNTNFEATWNATPEEVIALDGFHDYRRFVRSNLGAYAPDKLAAVGYFTRDIVDIYGMDGVVGEPYLLYKYKLSLQLDEDVCSEYASHLVPKAVSYSAGLLNYFFRGELEITEEIDPAGGWLIFYVSCDGINVEDLYDKIEVFIEDTDGTRFEMEFYEGSTYFIKDIEGDYLRIKMSPFSIGFVKLIFVYREEEEGEEIVIGKVLNIAVNTFFTRIGIRQRYGEARGRASEVSYSSVRNAAYMNFISNPTRWVEGVLGAGSFGWDNIAEGYVSAEGGEHWADQESIREYFELNLSYFQDKTINRILMPAHAENDVGLFILKDSSNSWPVIWGGGDILLYYYSPSDSGETRISEIDLELFNLSGINTFEVHSEDDVGNHIPLGGGRVFWGGCSGGLCEIIFYSEEEVDD